MYQGMSGSRSSETGPLMNIRRSTLVQRQSGLETSLIAPSTLPMVSLRFLCHSDTPQ